MPGPWVYGHSRRCGNTPAMKDAQKMGRSSTMNTSCRYRLLHFLVGSHHCEPGEGELTFSVKISMSNETYYFFLGGPVEWPERHIVVVDAREDNAVCDI